MNQDLFMQMNRATLRLVEVGRVRDGASDGRNCVGGFYKLNCKIPVVPVGRKPINLTFAVRFFVFLASIDRMIVC